MGGLPGCCYNERHDSCDTCFAQASIDCAHVAISCAGEYARQQDKGEGFSPTVTARRGSCVYNQTRVRWPVSSCL